MALATTTCEYIHHLPPLLIAYGHYIWSPLHMVTPITYPSLLLHMTTIAHCHHYTWSSSTFAPTPHGHLSPIIGPTPHGHPSPIIGPLCTCSPLSLAPTALGYSYNWPPLNMVTLSLAPTALGYYCTCSPFPYHLPPLHIVTPPLSLVPTAHGHLHH